MGLVLLGLLCQEVGAAVAVLLFPAAGAVGTVALRLVFSAVLLLAVFRPRIRGRSGSDWWTVIGFGAVLAGMNGCFYLALERLPLGPTVTIEYLGPLVLSVVVARRAVAWLWAAMALGGVVLLGRGGFDHLDPVGVLFALGAGALWVAYILLSARTGRRFDSVDGLALAMTVGGLVVIPFALATAGPALFDPNVLLLGAGVAVLSSAIPYAVELLALRRIPADVFAIVISCAPALAAVVGFVVLQQALHPLDVVAIALVVLASIGAVRASQRTSGDPTPV